MNMTITRKIFNLLKFFLHRLFNGNVSNSSDRGKVLNQNKSQQVSGAKELDAHSQMCQVFGDGFHSRHSKWA